MRSTLETALNKHDADRKVRGSERGFKTMFERHDAIMLLIDPESGQIVDANRSAERFYGYPKTELLEMKIQQINDLPVDQVALERQKAISENQNYFVFPHRLSSGEIRTVEVHSSPIDFCGKQILFSIIHDITERKRAEEAIRKSELKYRLLMENLRAGIVVHAPDTSIILCNELALELLGLTQDEIMGLLSTNPAWNFLNEDGSSMPLENYPVNRVLSTLEPISDLVVGVKRPKSDSIAWGLTSAYPVLDRMGNLEQIVVSFIDITERKKAQEQIKSSLEEKEVLLREIHHRVKNNLALVDSLLSLRTEYLPQRPPQEIFDDIKSRIRSMALAHEILYQSDNLAHLSVPEYIGNLMNHMIHYHGTIGTSISVEQDIDDVSFGLSTAIPLGFLLTELISNCLKHAFPQEREGKIKVSLGCVEDHEYELIVSDNGVGIPESVDLDNPQSMGMDLIYTFTEQLQGQLRINRNKGAEFRIRFREIGRKTVG